jgi:hypothetical protein
MEQFIAGQDPSKAWTDAEQEELVRIFQAALTNVNWSEIEHAAVVSRIGTSGSDLAKTTALNRRNYVLALPSRP